MVARWVRVLVLGGALGLGVGIAMGGCGSDSPPATTPQAAVVASAKPGVDHSALVALAGSLVGGADNLADPATGRLPDARAFQAAGIGTLTVSGSTIRVVFLAGASTTQRQGAEQALRSSPLIAAVTSQ